MVSNLAATVQVLSDKVDHPDRQQLRAGRANCVAAPSTGCETMMAMLEESEAARSALIEKEVANIIRLRTYGPKALQSAVEQATVSFIELVKEQGAGRLSESE